MSKPTPTVALVRTPCGTMWFTTDNRYAVSRSTRYLGRRGGRPRSETTYSARLAPVVEPGRIVGIEGGPEGSGVETWIMSEQPCQPTRYAWLVDVVAQLERDAAEAEARGEADGARQATVIREQIAKHRAEMAAEQSLAAVREGSS